MPLPSGGGIEAGGIKGVAAPAVTDEFRALMTSWRKPDKNGLACAHCHAPDAYDLAFAGFSDENVRRRANNHVSEQDGAQVVKLVNYIRKAHGIKPQDPMEFRPFQPGGKVLPGATYTERDFSLGKHLATKLPTLFGAPIRDTARAKQALDELLAYDARREPIGIAFPRWSEDGFHGTKHGTVNDWLPERPVVGKTPEATAAFFRAHDAYIEKPTTANLWAIQLLMESDAMQAAMFPEEQQKQLANNGVAWAHAKTSSMLFGQHLLRMEQQNIDATPTKNGWPVMTRPNYAAFDPFFAIGDFGNQKFGMEQLPPGAISTLSVDRQQPEGFGKMFSEEVLLEWWIMGWTFTPGVNHKANWQEYFPQSLAGGRRSGQTLPLHFNLITAKMAAHRTFSDALGKNAPTDRGVMLTHMWKGWGQKSSTDPHPFLNEEHQQLHKVFSLNLMRMTLHLAKQNLESQCKSAGKAEREVLSEDSGLEKELQEWLADALKQEPDDVAAADRQLAEETLLAREKGRHRCIDPFVSNGTGPAFELYTDSSYTKKLAGPLIFEDGF
ncbi:MAG: hypothetical protein ACRCV9_20940, partial [Burkholderiaceae bacterium]